MCHFQALRVSMEEQRQRQEDEQRRAQAASAQDGDASGTTAAVPSVAATSDETMLERVLAISETPVKRHRVRFISIFKFWFDSTQILSPLCVSYDNHESIMF